MGGSLIVASTSRKCDFCSKGAPSAPLEFVPAIELTSYRWNEESEIESSAPGRPRHVKDLRFQRWLPSSVVTSERTGPRPSKLAGSDVSGLRVEQF